MGSCSDKCGLFKEDRGGRTENQESSSLYYEVSQVEGQSLRGVERPTGPECCPGVLHPAAWPWPGAVLRGEGQRGGSRSARSRSSGESNRIMCGGREISGSEHKLLRSNSQEARSSSSKAQTFLMQKTATIGETLMTKGIACPLVITSIYCAPTMLQARI